MSDVIDVQNALVNLVSSLVYPNGIGQAPAGGVPCIIYAGWPTASRLDADLIAGKAHITVFPRTEERNTTRYPSDWSQQSINTPTLTLTISGQTITVGGTIPTLANPHVLMVMVNGTPYVYAVQVNDTLATIATALSNLINASIAGTTSNGVVITVPNAGRINAARVGITGTAVREVRRQERSFQITVWTDTPAHRDTISNVIDSALATIRFMSMPDGYNARLLYKSSPITDNMQKEKLYRRDFFYQVEFATTQTEVETQITQEQLNISKQLDGATSLGPVNTTFI